jgi:hypothetical protein
MEVKIETYTGNDTARRRYSLSVPERYMNSVYITHSP